MQSPRLHLVNRDFRDEFGVLGGFRVRRVEAIFILHENHRLAAELLSYEEASGVGAVRRDKALRGGAHPETVGRHSAENDCIHLC